MSSGVAALIAARPDRLRDGLYLLLTTLRQVESIHHADDISSALETVMIDAPDIVLLDADLADGRMDEVLQEIRSASPSCQCVVLVSSTEEMRVAKAAGAAGVLLKGFSKSDLATLIERVEPRLVAPRWEVAPPTTPFGADR